jgi:5'-nucleotidase
MRILLSNDDGILAPGLAALYEAVRDLGDVTVVAPDSPQSAAGHSITITGPLVVRNLHVQGPAPFDGLSVAGRPADCVRLAIFNLLDHKPDLVLSGINAGANCGIHVFYSGTVAAAAEGALLGVPAVAFSSALTSEEIDFRRDARYCRAVLRQLIDRGLSPGDLINVNVPAIDHGRPKGVRVVPQSTAELRDKYVKARQEGGRTYYEIADYNLGTHHAESDASALTEGYVTVTPLKIDRTDHDDLPRLDEITWPDLTGETD